MKICTKCNIEKDEKYFNKHGSGLKPQCKSCTKIQNDQYYLSHKKDRAQYYTNNKDKISEYNKNHLEEKRECQRSYRANNKEIIREKRRLYDISRKEERNQKLKNRKENEPHFKLRSNISLVIRLALKENGSSKKGQSIIKYLPYTIQELKEHLEKRFEPWMFWNNHGKYDPKTWNDNDKTTWTWQLDHIIPQANLPYTSMEDDNFKKCWALENLRPLSAKQNVIDGITRVRHRK